MKKMFIISFVFMVSATTTFAEETNQNLFDDILYPYCDTTVKNNEGPYTDYNITKCYPFNPDFYKGRNYRECYAYTLPVNFCIYYNNDEKISKITYTATSMITIYRKNSTCEESEKTDKGIITTWTGSCDADLQKQNRWTHTFKGGHETKVYKDDILDGNYFYSLETKPDELTESTKTIMGQYKNNIKTGMWQEFNQTTYLTLEEVIYYNSFIREKYDEKGLLVMREGSTPMYYPKLSFHQEYKNGVIAINTQFIFEEPAVIIKYDSYGKQVSKDEYTYLYEKSGIEVVHKIYDSENKLIKTERKPYTNKR